MKLPIVIQISFVSVAGWLHLHVGNVSPHCAPPGVSTHRRRIPHCRPLISVSPAHYAPTRRWGRWLGAFKYSVAGGEKQRDWNVDNVMGIRGNQGDSENINGGGNSGSSTGFYFMGLLFG